MSSFKAAIFSSPYILPRFLWLSATASDPPPSLSIYLLSLRVHTIRVWRLQNIYHVPCLRCPRLIPHYILQCLLAYVYSWWRGSCGSPTDLFCRFLWGFYVENKPTPKYNDVTVPLHHDSHLYLHLKELKAKGSFAQMLDHFPPTLVHLLCSKWPSYAPHAQPSSALLFTSLSICFCFAEQHWHLQACCSICLPQRSSSTVWCFACIAGWFAAPCAVGNLMFHLGWRNDEGIIVLFGGFLFFQTTCFPPSVSVCRAWNAHWANSRLWLIHRELLRICLNWELSLASIKQHEQKDPKKI